MVQKTYHNAGIMDTSDFTNAKILVVDDNELNLSVFCNLLKETKMQVKTAASGRECLEFASREHFDIIFLDHMMPEMDGIETLYKLRAMKGQPNEKTPVYALSANAVEGAKEYYVSEGFDGFVAKPMDSAKLELAIRGALPESFFQKKQSGESESSKGAPEDLPLIGGLDWNYAWLHLPDRALLMETMKGFWEVIDNQADKLNIFYNQLPEKDAFDLYRIQVHAMKSSATMVGIIILAGMANRLEYAARDLELGTIRAMHEIFLSDWKSYYEKLSGLFPEEEEAKKPSALMNLSIVEARLEMLKYSLLDFDIDSADLAMKEILGYRYPDGVSEKISRLKGAVSDLDTDEAAGLIEVIIRLLEE